jgi:hypothetical protein
MLRKTLYFIGGIVLAFGIGFGIGILALPAQAQAATAPAELSAPAFPASEILTDPALGVEAETVVAQTLAQPVSTQPSEQVINLLNGSGCTACHTISTISGANGQVGPNLSSIGLVAATRKANTDARTYIWESIVNPAAFIAPDCPRGACNNAMPRNFGTRLSNQQITLIVDYLATLGVQNTTALEPFIVPNSENNLPTGQANPTNNTNRQTGLTRRQMWQLRHQRRFQRP